MQTQEHIDRYFKSPIAKTDMSIDSLMQIFVEVFMPKFQALEKRVGTLEAENTILRGHVRRLTKRAE